MNIYVKAVIRGILAFIILVVIGTLVYNYPILGLLVACVVVSLLITWVSK